MLFLSWPTLYDFMLRVHLLEPQQIYVNCREKTRVIWPCDWISNSFVLYPVRKQLSGASLDTDALALEVAWQDTQARDDCDVVCCPAISTRTRASSERSHVFEGFSLVIWQVGSSVGFLHQQLLRMGKSQGSTRQSSSPSDYLWFRRKLKACNYDYS